MSRIGQQPVAIPAGVRVDIGAGHVKVQGPKGELARTFSDQIMIKQEGAALVVERASDEPTARALHGTTRALLNNMVVGVSAGWSKTLEVHGVGYRAELNGKTLVMSLGFSHQVEIEPPEGIEFEVENRGSTIVVKGVNKEQVGQIAAEVRAWRPPEPYRGKGIRYQGEHVRRKAGKAGKVG